MKRLLNVVSCGIAVAVLAACGGGGETQDGLAQSHSTMPLAADVVDGIVAETLASPSSAEPRALAKAAQGQSRRAPIYIVQLRDLPVTAYTGDVSDYEATKPPRGRKIDPNDRAVVRYSGMLEAKHDAKAQQAGGRKLHSYKYVFNGFAAELSEAQAAALAADRDVLSVTQDEMLKPDTVSTPSFLGLNAPGGIWSQLSGNADGNPIRGDGPNSSGAGEGIVVGIIDTGIWPENPSFSDRDADGKRVFQQLPGWHGRCVPGEAFNGSHCNQKLIAARWYNAGFGGDEAVKAEFPYEFASARGASSHGSHTAGTAAGNFGVAATAHGTNLGNLSGMAPRARVAAYKVCWGIGDAGRCFSSDSVAAIDQAVADGVDVLNYSISGSSTNFLDPVEIAFMFAADAGVFVAASAGNSGPTASTVNHPGPWLTTVAASTHDRVHSNTLRLGSGVVIPGTSLTGRVGPAPIVGSDSVGLPGTVASQVNLCFLGTLDPAKVTGKIVVCDRGVIARVEKSQAVRQAGGVGMVLTNVSPNTLDADLHVIPSIHVSHLDRAAVRAYAATAGAMATITASVVGSTTAPTTASFSSRGPLRAGGGDLLKPDITAPGVSIFAAASPVESGANFDSFNGTSMSSPHVAGLAALYKQRYPDWSPMAIKSAMMTTAYQRTITGMTRLSFGNAFTYGAGHVNPNAALNPGLVFDAGLGDWLGFLCGTQLEASFCTNRGIPVLDASNLNVASIAIGDLAGSQTVTRKVTNVSGRSTTYTVASTGLTGMTVTVSPATFTIDPGATQSVAITITNNSAAVGSYFAGDLVWTGNRGERVRIPTVVRPVALAAPASVVASAVTGASWSVKFGYTGPFSATPRGLVASVVSAGNVAADPDQIFSPSDPSGTVTIPVTINPGTVYARFGLFNTEVSPNTDIDVYVLNSAGVLVAASTNDGSNEEANLVNPPAGNYTVYLHGWGVPAGTSPYRLHTWRLGVGDAGNMTVSAPASATLGGTGTVNLTINPSLPVGRWLGQVLYGGAVGMPTTFVRVDK